tara:strand:- start:488 stop:2047 length:1560 start_codon:yes stop_codon:yes gene_type:complete
MTITNQTNKVGTSYTSKVSTVFVPQKDVGFLGKVKKTKTFTSLRVTKVSNLPGPDQYKTEVIQHKDAAKSSSIVIGEVKNGSLVLNENVDLGNAEEDVFIKQVENQIKNQKRDVEKQIKNKVSSDSESLFISDELRAKGITEEGVENGLGTRPKDDLKELQNRKGGIGRGGKNTYGALFYPSFIEKSTQDKIKITILEFAPKKKRKKAIKKTIQKTNVVPIVGNPLGQNVPEGGERITALNSPLYDVVTTTEQRDAFFGEDVLSFSSRKRMEFGKRTLGHITLPIPDGVSDLNKVNFTDGTLNPAEAFFADSVAAAFLGGKEDNNIGSASDALQDSFNAANKNNPEVKKALGGFFASKTLGLDKNAILARTEGQIFNDNLELLFKGPTLRTFNFRYKFSPRDESEIKQVMKIIRAFKQSSAVQKSKSGIFLVTPNTYKLEFKKGGRGLGNKNHMFLPKVKECALTQVAVDYMPEGSYMTYENEDPSLEGSMVSYIITLSFQELEPLFNDDYFTLEGIGF